MQWVYVHTVDNSARFVLGTVGQNPLVCFGINPSTAKPNALDPTVARVSGFATSNGYDSWIMLNVYPQIATNPTDLDQNFLPALKTENELQIEAVLEGRSFTLLAAWGVLINKRPYLRSLLRDIIALPSLSACDWVSLGQTDDGHPRHPSRVASGIPLEPFDMDRYR